MGKHTTSTTVYICDRCKVEVEADKRPNSPSDAWGTVKINQDAGWDFHGTPWAPRMREPVELCGACMEDVIRMVNGFQIRFDAPPGPESGRFIEVEDHTGASIGMGEWVEDDDGTWLLKMRPDRTPQEGEDHAE